MVESHVTLDDRDEDQTDEDGLFSWKNKEFRLPNNFAHSLSWACSAEGRLKLKDSLDNVPVIQGFLGHQKIVTQQAKAKLDRKHRAWQQSHKQAMKI